MLQKFRKMLCHQSFCKASAEVLGRFIAAIVSSWSLLKLDNLVQQGESWIDNISRHTPPEPPEDGCRGGEYSELISKKFIQEVI